MKTLIITLTIIFMSATVYSQSIPQSVKDSFNKKFPGITKVKWDKENKHEYEASFKSDNVKYSANFSDTGDWLETETGTTFDKLPQQIQDSFNSKYPGHTPKATAVIETSTGVKKYEIEYIAGKKTREKFFDANGDEVAE